MKKGKNFRKFLAGFMCAAILFSSSLNVFAQNIASSNEAIGSSGKFEMLYENPDKDFLDIIPYSTFMGNGGYAELTYGSSGRQFHWKSDVTKSTILPYTFSGEITITTQSTGKYRGTLYVSGAGLGKASGVKALSGISLTKNVNYVATFTGTGFDTLGKTFMVVPNAKIVFRYY